MNPVGLRHFLRLVNDLLPKASKSLSSFLESVFSFKGNCYTTVAVTKYLMKTIDSSKGLFWLMVQKFQSIVALGDLYW